MCRGIGLGFWGFLSSNRVSLLKMFIECLGWLWPAAFIIITSCFFGFWDTKRAPKHVLWQRVFREASTWYSAERDTLQFMCVGSPGLALWLALHIFATQCWWVPTKTRQLSTAATLLYWILSCLMSQNVSPRSIDQSCSLLSLHVFLADYISCWILR